VRNDRQPPPNLTAPAGHKPFDVAPARAPLARSAHTPRIIFLLLLVAVNLALFLPSMSGDFLWDDKYFISENPNIQGDAFFRTFLSSPFGGFSGNDDNSREQDRVMQFYRPLVSLSYLVDFRTWGLNAAAFHLTNILIHTANVIVLFYILIGLALSSGAAFLGAVLFSVYPLHFENVSWISGRTDLMAFLFGGLSVLFFIRFLKKRALVSRLGSGAMYFWGLLCKENVIFLPLIFLFFLYKREGKNVRVLFRLWPHALAFLGWLALRYNALGPASIGHSGRGGGDLLATMGFYAWKMICPFGLSLTVDSLPVFQNVIFEAGGALLTAGLILSVWQVGRRSPAGGWPYWAFLSWALLLLPSAAVVFSSSAVSLLAWRFLYPPSAVLIGAFVYSLERHVKIRALAVGVVVLLAVLYAAEIAPKNRLFGKSETDFWLSIRNPDREDVIARFNVAVKTLPTDEKTALRLFNDILSRTDQPSSSYWKTRIYEELGVYFAFRREFGKAEFYFSELFRLEPRPSLRLSFNYAYYLAFAGKTEAGERTVLEKLRQFPRNHFVLVQAAKFYVLIRDYGKAADLYSEDYRLFRNRQSAVLAQQAANLEPKTR
jgi:tetratricopeptide (TPR) repeat protein